MYSAFQSNNDDPTTQPFSMDASGMQECVDIAALNSRVKFDKTDVPIEQRAILGDATETGLTRFAGRYLRADYDIHVKKHRKIFEGRWIFPLVPIVFIDGSLLVPFNSINKWALVIVSDPDMYSQVSVLTMITD